jgi:site-specific DNA recombinase
MARTRSPSKPAASSRTRAIAYLRVSTDKQADSGLSLDAQRTKVEAYAALYDLDLVAVEVDAGRTAKALDRPALEQALAALRTGKADALLVAKLDRLTRSVRDLGDLLDRSTREGWAILSVGENMDTRTAAGRLVVNVLGAVAQWEREAIGERTAAAMAEKRARGEYTGGAAPYGWQVGADGRTLEADPREQEVMAAARNLPIADLSLRAVGAALEARGFLPRSGRWHAETVKAILAAEMAA